jgi:hypothetical protein
MNPVGMGDRALMRLEKEISEEFTRLNNEAFGGRAVVVSKNDPRHAEVKAQFDKLIERFPVSPHGSRFVNSTYTVRPCLHLHFSDLYPVFNKSPPGSLFLDEVGKAIDFGPLYDPELGHFTNQNTTLKLKNIRIKPGSELRLNECTEQDKESIHLNRKVVVGDVDINPELKKTEFLADVTFGDLINEKDFEIMVHTEGDENSTILIIPIKRLTTTFKIPVDGSFTAANGAKSYVEKFEGDGRQWINNAFTLNVCFPI